MNVRAARTLFVSLFLCLLAVPSFAIAGDAAAILAHCGPPSDDQILHPDSQKMSRVISYSDTQLFFSAENNDWSFTHATRASLPLPQDQLFASMHCVSDALEERAAAPPQMDNAVSPAIAAATSSEDAHERIFMILAILVLAGVLFFAIRPYMKSEVAKPPTPVAPRAPQRRPSAVGIRFARPEDPNPSGIRRVPRNDSTNDA